MICVKVVDKPGGVGCLYLIGIARHSFVVFRFQIVESAVPFPAVAMEGRHDLEGGFAGR